VVGRQIATGVDLRGASAVDIADNLMDSGNEDAGRRAAVDNVNSIAANRTEC
jgi:hypothetical protein